MTFYQTHRTTVRDVNGNGRPLYSTCDESVYTFTTHRVSPIAEQRFATGRTSVRAKVYSSHYINFIVAVVSSNGHLRHDNNNKRRHGQLYIQQHKRTSNAVAVSVALFFFFIYILFLLFYITIIPEQPKHLRHEECWRFNNSAARTI